MAYPSSIESELADRFELGRSVIWAFCRRLTLSVLTW